MFSVLIASLRELRVLSERSERAREKAVVSRGAAKNAKEIEYA
jgi:hypothetical protein